MQDLRGKLAVVTGGASGVGKGLARALDTGLWTAGRNRPAELERVKPRPPATTYEDFKRFLAEQGGDVPEMDTYELGKFCVQGVKHGRYIIGHGMDEVRAMLHRRADAIGACRLPEAHFEG